MTQRELERELSRVTGESMTTIRRRGFSVVEPADVAPLVVDWDELQAERMAIFPKPERPGHSAGV